MSERLITPELARVEVAGTTRASFLLRSMLAAGAVYGAGAIRPFVGKALTRSGVSDLDILNFALTLEYLESTFYERALTQVPNLSDDNRRLIEEIYRNEAQHVLVLRAAIKQMGGKTVRRPELSFATVFNSEKIFLGLANTFEDTGVSAYNGAAPLLRSKRILAAAGTIVQIEGRHAALIRVARGREPAPHAFDEASRQSDVLAATRTFFKTKPEVYETFGP